MTLYHGSPAEFNQFKQLIIWMTDSYTYALEFATFSTDDSYMYTCEIPDNLKLFDCGNTSVPCFGLFPPTAPYTFSPHLKNIIKKLDVDSNTLRDIIEEVAYDFDEPCGGYKMHLHVLTRSKQFKDLLMSKGYDGIKCVEEGYDTWGIFNKNKVKIIDRTDLNDSSDALERAIKDLLGQK